MQPLSHRARAILAVGGTAALAAAGGIAAAGAAPSSSKAKHVAVAPAPGPYGMPGGPDPGHGPGIMRHGPAVHSEEVVLNKAGDGYITDTEDNGTVKSVSGSDLTITEGTTKVPYKDVTVTIPDGATIVRNGKTAALSDLQAGDVVHVESSSDGTAVMAFDSSFRPSGPGRFGPRHGGPMMGGYGRP